MNIFTIYYNGAVTLHYMLTKYEVVDGDIVMQGEPRRFNTLTDAKVNVPFKTRNRITKDMMTENVSTEVYI